MKAKIVVLGLVILVSILTSISLPLINEGVRAETGYQSGGGSYPYIDSETYKEWVAIHNSLPEAYISPEIKISRGYSDLLDHLAYGPPKGDQGKCGNCWVWAGTEVLEIALDVQEGIKDDLSVQYFTSCWPGTPDTECACCGGVSTELADWYRNSYIIPSSNDNADWQDGNRNYYPQMTPCTCDPTAVPCEDISTSSIYPITSWTVANVPTFGQEQETAIANIKKILNNPEGNHKDKGIVFVFYLPNAADWGNFSDFWRNGYVDNDPLETAWDFDPYCEHEWTDQGGGHAVLCVGYDDTDPSDSYWIMMNSWGKTGGHPDGLFHVDMDMDYDCIYNRIWEVFDATFDTERSIVIFSPTQSSPASAGAYDYPSHIYDVTVEVKEETTPVTGLTNADFSFEIGRKAATASLTDDSTPGKYVFDVTPPHQDAAGKYDFEVALTYKGCTFGDREEEAVIYTTTVTAVDLTISSVNAPTSAQAGSSIAVSWTVRNEGNAASGTFNNRISLATTPYGTDILLGNYPMNSIAAGSSLSDAEVPKIPETVSPGYYYVTVFADAFGDVTESDDNNNINKAPNQIHITPNCGNMDVAPTSWSPTINCGESDSQIVTVSASGGMIRGVTVSKVSGPTWLSVSPTNLGDIASGSSKTFTMTASPTASLSSGTRDDFAYTVRVSNTCGSPSTRDVSGTIHVDCIEPSQPPSYSNPSVSPGSGTPSTQFDYSVDVSDPEGDTVTVTLKTYDPSDGSWEDQGNIIVVGSGTVFWNDLTPFEANDKGKTAKYTFVFDDGYNSGEWGPFNGPAIETDACFSNWDYPSTSMADEKIPVEVDISNPHGVKSAWLHYDYGDDGSEDGVTQMSLISVRGAKPEIRGGSSSGLGVKAQKIAVSESAPLSGGGGSGVAEREGIQKSIYLYDAKTCKDVEDSDPIGVTTVFSPTDSVSYTWLQFNDIWSSRTVKREWYAPNGNFYAECTSLIPDPSDSGQDHWAWHKCWSGIYINGYPAADEEGLWTVKVYLDGSHIETLYFNIEYIISDYTMCKNVQESSPYDPIERTSTFLADDEKAISWLRLDDVTNSLNVRWDWYDPSGTLYGSWDTDTSEPADEGYDYWDRVKAWCYIPIKDHAAAEKPGLWVVKVYIDDEYKFEEEFTIYPDDARYKCEIPAPGMDYAGDEVSFYVSAYSAYDSPTDSAKHLVDIYVPDDPMLSISPSSHDFDDKCEGVTDSTTFELWNSGTGILTYSLSETCGWVDVNPTSGSSTGEHDTITVDIDTTGLSEGTHTCDISINSNDGTGTFTVTVNVVPCPESSWTYMVYLDGDNNLEGAGIDDFMEMSSVGSTSDVNIVVQFDRIPGYDSSYGDWRDCKRFHVTYGMTPMPANAISDLGECNMGDPNTLRDFVDWAMTNFPADNYALILWNHGDGWKSINKWVPWADDIKDAKDAGLSRGICVDDTNNDYLSLQETEQALTGKYVQLLGYDACLMHMVEVVYQVMANAGVSVGSEESEPGDGWPYDTILNDLTGTPLMYPSILGETIVSRYIDSYAPATYHTQSAVDQADLHNLATAVENFAQALINELPDHKDEILQARTEVDSVGDYIDLYHFAELVESYIPSAASAAQAVMDNLGNAIYAEAHGSSHPNFHGLSIYFPEAEGGYLSSYENTKFAVDTHWDEFLKEYYGPSKPDLIITEKWLCWPDNCTICYNVTNIGDGTAPACHNTALYVDGVVVAHDHVPVDLALGESYTGCFNGYVWTYTPPSDDITVCADNNEIVDELDEDNNCLTNIWMCGDVTGDGRVRTSDGRRIFRHLTFGDPIDNLWAADVTGDGRVRTSDGRRIFRHLTFGVPLNCKCSG